MSNNTASNPAIEYDMSNSTLMGTDIISREEAKLRIVQLLIERKKLDYLDIVTELKLDLRLVVDICEELVKEGKIEDASKTD